MHIVFCKSLTNGSVSMTSAGNWDGLKYQMTNLDHFDIRDWDSHDFSIEHLKAGNIISDGAFLWRYVNVEVLDKKDFEIFEGRVISLNEIDG